MEIERRSVAHNIEFRADSKAPAVEGYAAVFGERANIAGVFIEIIAPGAFTRAIDDRQDVVFLVDHEGLPLARTSSGTLKLTQDDRGLHMASELAADDPDVMALVPKMQRGDMTKMSFAFRPIEQSWDESGDMPVRTIHQADVFDVSIVTKPAYDGTEIALRTFYEGAPRRVSSYRKQQHANRQRLNRTRLQNHFLTR